MLGFEAFLQDKAWLGFLAYIAVKEAWPFFRDRVWPRKIAEKDAERERLKNLEDRAAQSEERQTKSVESMSLSVQQMALAITTNNERLSQLITGHAEHARFTQDAIFEMHEKISNTRHPSSAKKATKIKRKP